MAIDEREGLQEHARFKGLRNTVPSDRFELGDLEAAESVDIDDSERVTRRKGHGAAVVSGACKSLWSNGATALAVQNETNLVQILPNYATVTLRTGLISGLDMSYTSIGARVYYSNSVNTGIVEGGRSRSWGITPPAGQPAAAVIGGVLPAGRYQFAVTFLRSDGQESGSSQASLVELQSTGGIRLSLLPVTTDADITHRAVFFSKRDGETLYRVGVLGMTETTFDYQMEESMRVPLSTQHLRPAPAGQLVGSFNGRTLVASGDTLFYSEPYAPELFDLRKNHRFASPITLVAGLDSGVYLGTLDEVLWLGGSDPQKWTFSPRLAYGAILGAATTCSRDMILDGAGTKQVVVFATTQGVCVGADGGEIVNMTQDRFLYPQQERGAAVIRRHRGMVQALVSLQGAETAANVSS